MPAQELQDTSLFANPESFQYQTHKRQKDRKSRSSAPRVSITNISEDVAGVCQYPALGACVATSTHSAVLSDVYDPTQVQYVWSVESGTGVIDAGQGTSTVTVSTASGSTDEVFDLKCFVFDGIRDAERTASVTHTKSQSV